MARTYVLLDALDAVVRTRNAYHVLLANGRFDQVDQLVPQIRDMADRLKAACLPAHSASDDATPPAGYRERASSRR